MSAVSNFVLPCLHCPWLDAICDVLIGLIQMQPCNGEAEVAASLSPSFSKIAGLTEHQL